MTRFLFLFVILLLSVHAMAAPGFISLDAKGAFKADFDSGCHSLVLDDSGWERKHIWEITEFQHGCLRLPIDLPEISRGQALMFSFAMLASANIYWDGKLLVSKGRPGNSKIEEITGPVHVYAPLAHTQLVQGQHLLSIELSTYHHSEDLYSIFYGIGLADLRHIERVEKEETLPAFLMIGALLILSTMFAFVYFIYQRDSAYLLFSILCCCSALLIFIEFARYFYAYPWDFHLTRLRTITLVTLCCALLLPAYYLAYFKFNRKLIVLAIIAVLLVLVMVLSPSYDARSVAMFLISMLSTLIVCLYAIRSRLRDALVQSGLLIFGIGLLIILPFDFIQAWFAAFFSLIALSNIFSLVRRFASDRNRALSALRLESELLRRNLQPHFLMNSLMLVVEWIETKPEAAVGFIEALAEEFRLLNTMSKERFVSITQELKLCQMHVSIMSQRYQVHVGFEVCGDTDDISIPPAILHTLLENAFSHNVIREGDKFTITLEASEKQFRIEVLTPYRRRGHEGSGTGESYIRAQLAEKYERNTSFIGGIYGEHWRSVIVVPRDKL